MQANCFVNFCDIQVPVSYKRTNDFEKSFIRFIWSYHFVVSFVPILIKSTYFLHFFFVCVGFRDKNHAVLTVIMEVFIDSII